MHTFQGGCRWTTKTMQQSTSANPQHIHSYMKKKILWLPKLSDHS